MKRPTLPNKREGSGYEIKAQSRRANLDEVSVSSCQWRPPSRRIFWTGRISSRDRNRQLMKRSYQIQM